MTQVRRYLIGTLALLLLLIVLLAYGCRGRTVPLIETPPPGSPLALDDDFTPRPVVVDPALPYLPAQVLLAGEADDVARLLVDERLAPLALRPLGALDVDPGAPGEQQPLEPPAGAAEDSLPPQSYLLAEISSGDFSVPEALDLLVETIAALNESGGDPVAVLPSPNFLVANPWGIDADPWGIDADPWGIDADPWGIDADPWGIDADPWSGEGIGSGSMIQPNIPQELNLAAWQQWSLIGPQSIDLYRTPGPVRSVEQTGSGVDVFVFDTSPFQGTSVQDLFGRRLFVYHPPLPLEIPSGRGRIKEHGFFAAGLVRLVAPNSRFHLVRVLNEDGAGDLFSFIAILTAVERARGGWAGSVLNLSMSVRDLDGLEGAAREALRYTPEQIARLKKGLPAAYHALLEDDVPVPALFAALRRAAQGGAIIVAAAGNDSDTTQGRDLPTGLPARWPFTIAAAGSQDGGNRACFSNQPEAAAVLFAPGGEGADPPQSCTYPFRNRPADWRCPSLASRYDCRYAVTSVAFNGGRPIFAHWVGTSFATPLVSGTAALMAAEARGLDCALAPAQIKVGLVAAAGGGVVRVPAAVQAARTACGAP